MKKSAFIKLLSFFLVLTVLGLATSVYFHTPAKADEAEFGLVRFNRMKAGSSTFGGTVCLEPAGNETNMATVTVSFSNGDGATTGFTLSGTAADFTADTDADLPEFGQYPGTTATAFPGIDNLVPTIGGPNNHTLTYTLAGTEDLADNTIYCFHFGAGLSSRGTAASDLTGSITTTGTPGMLATYATATITEDEITVTATVPQIFQFSLDGTSITLGNLSTSTVSTDSIEATLSTNAKNGWISWVKNSTNGLYSTNQATSISVPAGSYGTLYDLSSTTGYVLDVDTGTGTPTIDDAYDGANVTSGGILQSSFKQIAFATGEASADTFTMNFRAKIDPAQPPASDYTDTVTIAAAGEF